MLTNHSKDKMDFLLTDGKDELNWRDVDWRIYDYDTGTNEKTNFQTSACV